MSGPVARVEFVPTLDERADVVVRFTGMSPSMRRRSHRTIAILAAISAVVAGAVVFLVWQYFNPGRWPTGMIATAVIVALITAWLGPLLVLRAHRRKVREAMATQFGDAQYPFVVELHVDRVAADAVKFKVSLPWRNVLAVTMVGNDVEIRGVDALIVVRARAFASLQAAAAFRDQAIALRTRAPAALAKIGR